MTALMKSVRAKQQRNLQALIDAGADVDLIAQREVCRYAFFFMCLRVFVCSCVCVGFFFFFLHLFLANNFHVFVPSFSFLT
jgi:hypothetical protein